MGRVPGIPARQDEQLSAVDRVLIGALVENGRASFTTLAKKVGLSASTVRRHLSALERRRVIRGYTAVIDPGAFGRPTVAFFSIRLRSDAPAKPPIGERLHRLPEIAASYTLSGDRPHMAVGRYPNPEAAQAATVRLGEDLHARIRVDFVLEARFGDMIWSPASPVEPPLRDTDRIMLEALIADGRASIDTLARKMGLSSSTAHKHLQALQECRIIRGYTTLVDSGSLGLPVEAVFTIKPLSNSPSEPSLISEWLCSFPEVKACYTLSGGRPSVAVGVYRDIAAAHSAADLLRKELRARVGVDFVLATDFDHDRQLRRSGERPQ